jgi:hypothetical protein
MIFKFKKSKFVVDCFTYSRAAYELYKIRKAVLFYPETIKKMAPQYSITDKQTNVNIQAPTVKKCTGINGLYTKGAIMPLWMDYVAQPIPHTLGESALGVTDPQWSHRVQQHDNKQYSPLFDGYHHVKFGSVWNLVEESGIKFIWMPALYNLEEHQLNDKIIVPPGLTYYDEQPQTNINLFIKRDAENFILRAGTPLIHIVPLTEKEVEWKCHLVDHEEWVSKNKIPPDLSMHYEGVRNLRYTKDKAISDKMDAEEKKGKCPFGFGR